MESYWSPCAVFGRPQMCLAWICWFLRCLFILFFFRVQFHNSRNFYSHCRSTLSSSYCNETACCMHLITPVLTGTCKQHDVCPFAHDKDLEHACDHTWDRWSSDTHTEVPRLLGSENAHHVWDVCRYFGGFAVARLIRWWHDWLNVH